MIVINNMERDVMAYSEDLKQRVLAYVRGGGRNKDASELFQVSLWIISHWLKQPSDHVRGTPGPKRSRKFDREELRVFVQENPDLMLKEMGKHFNVHAETIRVSLKKLGFTRKKRPAVRSGS